MLTKASENNLVNGLGPLQMNEKTKCLQYADDIIIFCKAKKKEINSLKIILYTFELLTGLKINFNKINIIDLGLSNEETEDYINMLGCPAA